jgi:hypothetical protein
MSKKRWPSLKIVLLLFGILLTAAGIAFAAAKVAKPVVQNSPPSAVASRPDAAGNTGAASDESELAKSLRKGGYPTQLAGQNGSIRPNRHGPYRNDPKEGIPAHAYSPFDERKNREHPCPRGGCDFVEDQVLIKLASPSRPLLGQAQGALTADASLNNALAAHGVQSLDRIFPHAQAPKAGEFVQSPNGEKVPKPDLTKWHRARLPKKADIHKVVDSLRQQSGVEHAEPNYLRRPVGGSVSGALPLAQDAQGAQQSMQIPPDPPLTKGGADAGDPTYNPPLANRGEDRGSPDLTRMASYNPPLAKGGKGGFSSKLEGQLSSLPDSSGDPLFDLQWHLGAANIPAAWQWLEDHGLSAGGSRDIVVAVIDTGVDYNHP